MNLVFRVAINFIRRRNRLAPSFTAIVSVLGVSFGVAAFLVVVTVFNSFENELRSILLAANPNLVVYKIPSGIPDAQGYKKRLDALIDKKIEQMSLFEYNEAILSHENRTAAVVMRAIEGELSSSGNDLARAIEPTGALSTLNNEHAVLEAGATQRLPAIILGKGLALKLGVKTGDEVNLSSGSFGSESENRFQRFQVTGIMSLGLGQYDEKLALINFKEGAFLFGAPSYAKGIEIRFRNPADALAVSKKLQTEVPYSVRAWQEIDSGLFEQIERDGAAIKLIVLIITLVAAFNIIVTLSLSVIDHAKQIALLRSLGASRGFIIRVFVSTGLTLGAFGALLGVAIGVAILKVFAGFELGELQAFYFLERIPVEYDVGLMLSAIAVAMVLSFLSALYPAYKATRVSPLHGLKPGY